MKIYTKIEWEWVEHLGCYVVSDSLSHDYDGPMILFTGAEEGAAAAEAGKGAADAAAATTASDVGAGLVDWGMMAPDMGASLGGAAAADAAAGVGAMLPDGSGWLTGPPTGVPETGGFVGPPEGLPGTGGFVGPSEGLPGTGGFTGPPEGLPNTGSFVGPASPESAAAPADAASSTAPDFSVPAGTPTDMVPSELGTTADWSQGLSQSPENLFSQVKDVAQAASEGDDVKKALDKLQKYGPLAMGGLNMLQSRGLAGKYASQMGNIGATQRGVANEMIAQAQAGNINPADQYAIDQWKASAVAQAKNYYAKAGLSDSSMATGAIADIEARATAMHEEARQKLLTTGMNALNVVDKYQAAAIQAEMSGDQAAAKQASDFLNTYGQWMNYQSGKTTTPANQTTPATT